MFGLGSETERIYLVKLKKRVILYTLINLRSQSHKNNLITVNNIFKNNSNANTSI